MNRNTLNQIFNNNLNSLARNLGTNAGTFISVLSLFGMGFTAGKYYNDYVKNIEILDIKKEAFNELKDLKDKNQYLNIEIKELKNRHDILTVEVTELKIKLNTNEKKR